MIRHTPRQGRPGRGSGNGLHAPVPVQDNAPPTEKKAASLQRLFRINGVEDAVNRVTGEAIAASEVQGIEAEPQILLAFAAALNSLDFPVQILVRQHAPHLSRLREETARRRPTGLTRRVQDASVSLDRFLGELEQRPGVLDRRFYALCHQARADELGGLLSRAGLSAFRLRGRALRSLVLSILHGRAPGMDAEAEALGIAVGRTGVESSGGAFRTLHLAHWPRTLAPGFLQGVFALGIPLDLSIHAVPIPAHLAARTLEWQKVKMESSSALSFKRGRSPSPETEMALEDVARLRDGLHRGRERLFHASVSLTLHADSKKKLREWEQEVRNHFAGVMASLDGLAFRQREGRLSTLPIAMNGLGAWRTVDTTSLAYLFPFSPPDLDTRRGTLFGLDLRAGSPVTFDFFDPAFLNANSVVLARSGAGKSFSTKLGMLRGIARGITYYVIDPEGEYAALAEAAGGRVLTPGIPGHGLNPFVVERGDDAELLQRIGGLRRLVEVMVGERLRPEQRAVLDETLTAYYCDPRGTKGFQDFFRSLSASETEGAREMAQLLRPFATGSLRNLLTDEGADLLGREAPITVFNLRLLEPELRPAATLVCAEAVWAMATRHPKPRVLVVDEVWSIMQHPEGAAFMVSLSKRARKHLLGLLCITQDVQDFLGEDTSRPIVGHSGRVLLQNSAFKLLLQQDAAALQAVQESFGLAAADAQWLASCPRGDGMLMARGGRFPVRILATPEEHRLLDGQGALP